MTLFTDTPDVNDPLRTALTGAQIGTFTFELESVQTPDPSSLALCGMAVLGMLRWRRRLHGDSMGSQVRDLHQNAAPETLLRWGRRGNWRDFA